MMCSDRNSDMVKADHDHPADHEIIFEAVNGCDYIITGSYCSNPKKVLEKGGTKIYKLPPIIKDPDLAVKNLLVNLGLATHLLSIKKTAR
jgi:predicted Fe-Mo cluster-binding NifX family protein